MEGKEGSGETISSSQVDRLPLLVFLQQSRDRTYRLGKRDSLLDWQRGNAGSIYIFAPGSWCACG